MTQATVSRDIRDLKLTKVSLNGGKQKYVIHRQDEDGMSEKYIRVLRDGYMSMDMAQNILSSRRYPEWQWQLQLRWMQ